MEACYKWINKPRIITYSNPRKIMDNPMVRDIITRYPHLCASDTLLMGMNSKYQRDSFGYLSTVDSFIEHIFNPKLNSKEKDLQMFIDISNAISELDTPEKSLEYRALMSNRGQLVDAFKMLTMIGYEANASFESVEQQVFFEKIYSKLSKDYINDYTRLIEKTTYKDYCSAYEGCLIDDLKYNLGDAITGKTIDVIKEELESLTGNNAAERYLKVLEHINEFDIGTVVIHGIARFTPQIMILINTLDRLGIKVVFLINYAENLPSIYGFWKKTYEWVGVEFECVDSLDLSTGNTVGKNIAQICEGKRPTDKPHAEIIKYTTITDFTDGPVRSEFAKAELKANEDPYKRSALGHMKTQYYAVSADRPNDILRNYFPNQFLEKPFLSYPIGQFIKALFDMWNFDSMDMKMDYDALKECAAIKIGHNADNMIQLIENVKLYLKDVECVNDVINRLDQLKNSILAFDDKNRNVFAYLSYFTLTAQDIEIIKSYFIELDKLSRQIFGSDKSRQVDYKGKFKELVSIVSGNVASDSVLSHKEDELIDILIQSLSISGNDRVVGSIRELRDALNFFLSVKREHSGADWIIRGFDQIDGAPLMKMPPGRIYEFAMMSMKNMTKTTRDILPWPLDEAIFSDNKGLSIYLEQVKNTVELRNEYLRFYFFYGAFFSKGAQIKFSYIENDNGEKQRPYYLLDLLELPIITTLDKKEKVKFYICDDQDGSQISTELANHRELNIFSICPYKYFLIKVLGNKLYYSSEYHTNYYIENEIVNLVEIECNYDKSKVNEKLSALLAYFRGICPYLDESTISDIDRFVRKNFSEKRRGEDYLQKKRDFLVAKWKNLETSEEYMKYNKTIADVKKYMKSSDLFPGLAERPYEKTCEECNYNELCLNYYLDKEVDA